MSFCKRLLRASIHLGIVGLISAFIFGIVAAAYFAAAFPDWTGFGPPLLDAQGHELLHGKTLWDWLGLLLVPLVIAVGGYFLTRSENRYALSLQERREQEARKLEEQRTQEARRLEAERVQDTALQAYLDQMTALLLHEKLRTSEPDDEVRSVARARTLTALRVLDGVRKATILQFLYEANLIGGIQYEDDDVSGMIDAILNLAGADLSGAHLSRAHLSGAHLEGAHLSGAHLEGAHLSGAHLEGAYLSGAYLGGAYLGGADLNGADLNGADLNGVYLNGADLNRANLDEANLEGAHLSGTHLEGAHLSGAHLEGANLEGAHLTGCTVTREQLAQAYSLEGVTLPAGMAPLPTITKAPKYQTPKPQRRIEP